jgi:hypothetical protein
MLQASPMAQNQTLPARPKSRKGLLFKGVAAALVVAVLAYSVPKIIDWTSGSNPQPSATIDGEQASDFSHNLALTQVKITYSEKDYEQATAATGDVSPEQPSIEMDGIFVDFGPFNLEQASSLTIKTLEPKTDPNLGLSAQLYDFTLTNDQGELSAFNTVVQVVLPCPAAADEIAFVQHYDEDTSSWQMLPAKRNLEEGTITVLTTHFSGFGIFTSYDDVLTPIPGSLFSYVGEYNGPSTPIMITDGDVDQLIATINMDQMAMILRSGKVPADIGYASALSTLNNLSSATGVMTDAEMALTTFSRAFSKGALSKVNPVMTAVGAALVMGRISYQLYQGVNPATVVIDNGFNIVEAALSIAAIYTGAVPLAFAALAVFTGGLIYDSLQTDEPGGWAEFTYHHYVNNALVFNSVTMSCEQAGNGGIPLDIGGEGCEAAVKVIFKQYRREPDKLQKTLERLFSDLTNTFWELPEETRNAYYQKVVNERFLEMPMLPQNAPANFPRPDPETVNTYKLSLKRLMLGRLQPLMRAYVERNFLELKEALLHELNNNLVPMLNESIEFHLIDPETKGRPFSESPYAQTPDFQILFGEPVEKMFEPQGLDYSTAADHLFKVQKDSNLAYRCNLYYYISRGCPDTIEIYPEDPNEEPLVVPFTCDLPVTTIQLGGETAAPPGNQFSLVPGESVVGYTQAIEQVLQLQSPFQRSKMAKETLQIETRGVADESSNQTGSADAYEVRSSRTELENLTLSGAITEGGVCMIEATVIEISSQTRVEKDEGDYYSVVESWISSSQTTRFITGSGQVSFESVNDPVHGTLQVMVLRFDALKIAGRTQGRSIYKHEHPKNASLNGEEVRGDTSETFEDSGSLVLRFAME